MQTKIRRYDLDWLRVIVFGLLIFYHVGMFFVPWEWHIKNNTIYSWLQWPMLFLNQWRLPILFVISGMGTYYAFGKRTVRQFNWERFKRLGIPLIFGILFIVPPQIYFERLANDQFIGSYWGFFTTVARDGIYPEGNFSWHHLWFLPYLLIFSWVLSPIFLRIRKNPGKFVQWIKRFVAKPLGLYWFILPLYLWESLVEPFFDITHDLIRDWFAIINYSTLFFYGFVLISLGDTFWESVEKIKRKALIIGSVCFVGLMICWQFEDGYTRHFTEALLKVVNLWSWILVLFAYASQYLNRPSKTLAYANRAVYPFYILHQTVTIAIGYYLMNLDWGFIPKAIILVVGTFGISWLIYDLIILRIPLLHPLFGLKKPKAVSKSKLYRFPDI
ncbi:acyltransferase family protein [Flagellimonas marina]|uniref:Acyltransferase family protein n=1 Tax=Flagellimonas marina TaxID=1775168 RepID=A0ABV8PQN7_9FLAO